MLLEMIGQYMSSIGLLAFGLITGYKLIRDEIAYRRTTRQIKDKIQKANDKD